MVNGRIDDRAIFRYKSFLRAWCYWSRIKSSGLWHHTYIRDEIEWHQMKTHADFVFQQYIFTHVARSFHQAICNNFLTWISAQVKEMGGFAFRNCEIHFSLVFWVRNKWKMFDFFYDHSWSWSDWKLSAITIRNPQLCGHLCGCGFKSR